MTKQPPIFRSIPLPSTAPRANPESRGWFARHEVELLLSVRMTLAGLLTFALANVFGLRQGYWGVLTVVIVMQASVGGSLKATFERVIGTLAGATWAIVLSVLLVRSGSISETAALVAALAPLTVLAALQPAYRVAPITAIIVLLGSVGQPGSALQIGFQRVLDIVLGCVVAFAVSLLVLPSRAHKLLAQSIGDALMLMADAIVLTGEGGLGGASQDRIRSAVGRAAAVADEAKRERLNHLTDAPDPAPIVRTLRRVRHDLEMIGRASDHPLPQAVRGRLAEPHTRASGAIAEFLRGAADALAGRAAPPSLERVETALGALAAAVERLREDGISRPLSADDMGRLFGTAFAFEQLRNDLEDLANRAREFSRA
ncbi:MAG TPA: FUSC family protein [Candidatus Limnocylindria bacterium]|nr:FUSC family protein [Candidatus Limnocylindria bacterium]